LLQAVLRVDSEALDAKKQLLKAATILFRIHPESTIYAQVTCNLLLFKPRTNQFSLFFGQRFGPSSRVKRLYVGTKYHSGVMTRKSKVWTLHAPTDALRIPTKVDRQAFSELFNAMFQESNVEVVGIPQVITIFTKILDNYEQQKTTGNKLIQLF
jgi:hypothetical protein